VARLAHTRAVITGPMRSSQRACRAQGRIQGERRCTRPAWTWFASPCRPLADGPSSRRPCRRPDVRPCGRVDCCAGRSPSTTTSDLHATRCRGSARPRCATACPRHPCVPRDTRTPRTRPAVAPRPLGTHPDNATDPCRFTSRRTCRTLRGAENDGDVVGRGTGRQRTARGRRGVNQMSELIHRLEEDCTQRIVSGNESRME
jgi:hypothetical protein